MGNALTILIIDDSPDDREHYIRSLKKVTNTNYHCIEAENGRRGMDMADAQSADCVLLDYSLPGMNGLEVLKSIRSRHTFMPIILLTGQGNEAVAVQAIKEGAHDYLTKSSVTPERLHQAIRSAIDQCQMKRNLAQKDEQILTKTAELEQSVSALELAKKEQELLISKLMESNSDLERFAYACSHDLQEPLRMISNFSERLERHLNDVLDDKARHYLKYVTDGAGQARQLISDVLNYARVDHQAEQLTNIESEKTLSGVLRDLSARIEETGASVTHDPLPEVCMQSTHLRQLLQNLIGNALKFCAGKPQVHIGAEQEGMMWRFYVRDNGIGIPVEHRQKIFIVFQRLHNRERYPGTGIGLALCKKLVQKYGGKIWLESEEGKGTTFYFTLPPAAKQTTKAA